MFRLLMGIGVISGGFVVVQLIPVCGGVNVVTFSRSPVEDASFWVCSIYLLVVIVPCFVSKGVILRINAPDSETA